MKIVRWVTVLCVLLCPEVARADVVAPGFKFRELRVVIDNLEEYPNQAFYLVAASWVTAAEKEVGPGKPSQPPRVTSGVNRPGYPSRFVHNWLLVAVPRERADVIDWDALAAGAPGVVYSNRVHLAQPRPALVVWPNDYEVRHFRVTLADGQLTLTPGAIEEGADGFSSWLPGIISAGAVGGLGFWVARRLRRPRTAPTHGP